MGGGRVDTVVVLYGTQSGYPEGKPLPTMTKPTWKYPHPIFSK